VREGEEKWAEKVRERGLKGTEKVRKRRRR
jgi:hypothetical protein